VDKLRWSLLAFGIALLGLLVTRIGVSAIGTAFERLSWRLLIVVCFPFVLVNIFDTLGWRFALPSGRVPFITLFAARLTGEVFNATTPTASLGGEPVKAALVHSHVDYRVPATGALARRGESTTRRRPAMGVRRTSLGSGAYDHQRTIWALLAFEAWRVAYFGEVAVL
jgi:Lysylphosphatidylglycerol synthase TM region